jgi:hypothetical protein
MEMKKREEPKITESGYGTTTVQNGNFRRRS